MRIQGAMISPRREDGIYPIIEEPFDYDMPELEGAALVAFLHTFVALWPKMDETTPLSSAPLSPVQPARSPHEFKGLIERRAVAQSHL